MSYKIRNTALDHDKRFLHRRAHKMQMEPVLAGRRLRLRSSMVISDENFDHNKANLELYKRWGVVTWEKVGGEGEQVESDETPATPEAPAAGDKPRMAVDLMLIDAGENHIAVVKILREQAGMDLKEASDLLAMVPVAVLKGATETQAKELDLALTGAGAKTDTVWVPSTDKTSPPAETASKSTKPQPKSPFKGKKS